MKTMMAKSFQDLSSKRQFHWSAKVSNEEEEQQQQQEISLKNPSSNLSSDTYKAEERKTDNIKSSSLNTIHENKTEDNNNNNNNQSKQESTSAASRRKLQTIAVARLKSVVTAFGRNRGNFHQKGLGNRVVGTLYGHRRGHVHFAFQKDSSSQPAFLVELATPISGLVREMASGLVRIALECDKQDEKKSTRLIDEPMWRTYCNGKKCGFATKRECGVIELQILKAVEPISMGAGVLPAAGGNGEEGDSSEEIMFMRAKFERVIGSRDSEAFYMMNPDSNGAPELSIYLLRV